MPSYPCFPHKDLCSLMPLGAERLYLFVCAEISVCSFWNKGKIKSNYFVWRLIGSFISGLSFFFQMKIVFFSYCQPRAGFSFILLNRALTYFIAKMSILWRIHWILSSKLKFSIEASLEICSASPVEKNSCFFNIMEYVYWFHISPYRKQKNYFWKTITGQIKCYSCSYIKR